MELNSGHMTGPQRAAPFETSLTHIVLVHGECTEMQGLFSSKAALWHACDGTLSCGMS